MKTLANYDIFMQVLLVEVSKCSPARRQDLFRLGDKGIFFETVIFREIIVGFNKSSAAGL